MTTQPQAALPPQAVLMQMIHGKCVSRCVSLAAELGIADLLAGGPGDAGALAAATGTNPGALYRVLRMLAGLGVFLELENRTFRNNRLSEALRGDVPGSVRDYARFFGCELHWQFWTGMDYSVRTGNPWSRRDHPDQSPFEVLAAHLAAQQAFNRAMSGLSAADGPAIVQAYDFSKFGRIVDVGGGHGMLAGFIAAQAPLAKITVFDLHHVLESASREGIDFIEGSFLDNVPGPADLCVLKHILHDWDDETARRILRNCREALSDNGRVLVCEMVVASGREAIPALILDIEMMTANGGRERTAAEYTELFASAGLRLEQIIPTHTPIVLLEASGT